jgi:[acyl-carrier-protein] S-malonyltransferase
MNGHATKSALLFPGQGLPLNTEHVRSFYDHSPAAKELFDTIDYNFGSNVPTLRQLCLEGGPELQDTRYSQAAIFLASVAIAKALEENGFSPDAVAGLSLGEYSALCTATSFDIQDGVDILAERGRIMADFIPKDTGMAAVIGLNAQEVEAYCKQVSAAGACEIATYSTHTRLVATGALPALEQLKQLCEQHDRVKVMLLGTSRAFHSSLARPAAAQFDKVLKEKGFTFHPPQLPIYYNRDGTTNYKDIASLEVGQFYSPVNLTKTVEEMCKDGIRRFVAIGPGVSMAAYARETAKENDIPIETHVIERFEDVSTLIGKALGATHE